MKTSISQKFSEERGIRRNAFMNSGLSIHTWIKHEKIEKNKLKKKLYQIKEKEAFEEED